MSFFMQSYIKGTPNNVVVYNCEESNYFFILLIFVALLHCLHFCIGALKTLIFPIYE